MSYDLNFVLVPHNRKSPSSKQYYTEKKDYNKVICTPSSGTAISSIDIKISNSRKFNRVVKHERVGIPDLVALKENEVPRFVEIKRRGDGLRLTQIQWIMEHIGEFPIDVFGERNTINEVVTLSFSPVSGVDKAGTELSRRLMEEINEHRSELESLKEDVKKLKKMKEEINIGDNLERISDDIMSIKDKWYNDKNDEK